MSNSTKRTQAREPKAMLTLPKQKEEEEKQQTERDKRIDEVFWESPARTSGTEIFLKQLAKEAEFSHTDTLGAPESGDKDDPYILNMVVIGGEEGLEPALLNFVDPVLAHEDHRIEGCPAYLECVEIQPCNGILSLDFAVEKLSTVEELKVMLVQCMPACAHAKVSGEMPRGCRRER